jgi:hypothetical protein
MQVHGAGGCKLLATPFAGWLCVCVRGGSVGGPFLVWVGVDYKANCHSGASSGLMLIKELVVFKDLLIIM